MLMSDNLSLLENRPLPTLRVGSGGSRKRWVGASLGVAGLGLAGFMWSTIPSPSLDPLSAYWTTAAGLRAALANRDNGAFPGVPAARTCPVLPPEPSGAQVPAPTPASADPGPIEPIPATDPVSNMPAVEAPNDLVLTKAVRDKCTNALHGSTIELQIAVTPGLAGGAPIVEITTLRASSNVRNSHNVRTCAKRIVTAVLKTAQVAVEQSFRVEIWR
jgi:hypothetical protein